MNLIEQLGGYEKAKEWVNPSIEAISQEVLKSELLEYRRQHNILEVGDKVVSKHKNLHLFDDVVLDIAYFRDDLKERDDLKGLGSYVRFTNGNDFKLDALRHATDAEIAAGRRLP